MQRGGKGERMQTIRTAIISILALGLLAGSAVGAAAQDEDGPAAVDGSISVDEEACTETDVWNECPMVIEASDQRLSGDGVHRGASVVFQGFDDGAGVMVIVNSTVRVENTDGAWSGGGPLFALPTTRRASGTDQPTWVLTGEGGYNGLTALLRVDLGRVGYFRGVIFEGDLPAAPPLE
jgi:hypothetical protein